MRDQILNRLWNDDEPLLFITKEQYLESLESWDIVTYGESFVALVKGPSFHFHSFAQGDRLPLRVIKNFLQNLINEHGHAETRTPHEYEKQHRFNRLLGFKECGRDEFDVIYRIERIRCQS
jgi:hypothetical protein